MPRVIIEWVGREYEFNPKSADWYWAVGVVAAACTLAAFLLQNYLLVILIVVAAAVLLLHAAKEPVLHHFILTERGLVIGNDLHPFENMHSFSVLEHLEGTKPPLLSIKTESWLTPHLLVPLENVEPDLVYQYFLDHVEEAEHQHSLADVVAAWLQL